MRDVRTNGFEVESNDRARLGGFSFYRIGGLEVVRVSVGCRATEHSSQFDTRRQWCPSPFGQQPALGDVHTAALVAPRSTPASFNRAKTRLPAGSKGMEPDA